MRPEFARLVQEVSLTVRSGEHWALLGPNGAGKSTLLGLLGTLVHPTRGTVEVLTGDQVGKCFDLPLTPERHGGRWTVRVEPRA